MFNRARFNTTPFNAEQLTGIALCTNAVLTVHAIIIVANQTYLFTNTQLQVSASVSGNQGILLITNTTETVSASLRLQSLIELQAGAIETVDGTVWVDFYFYATQYAKEAVLASLILGADYYTSKSSVASIGGILRLGASYYANAFPREIVDAWIGIDNLSTEIVSLNLAIPPNGKLVIDSDNYLVMVNGENFMDAHSGAWLDELCRNVIEITVEGTNTTNIASSLLYTERYL